MKKKTFISLIAAAVLSVGVVGSFLASEFINKSDALNQQMIENI